jgi:hypothetical protein
MPTLMELRSRFTAEAESHEFFSDVDEVLVADTRGRMTPSQIVEQKLRGVLRHSAELTASLPRFRPRKPK